MRTAPIYQVLQSTGLPCAYSHFRDDTRPPYLVYIGTGQNVMTADDTVYWKEQTYQVEYYFIRKDEDAEGAIETALLDHGYIYEKSEDVYIEDQGVFMIYYYV